MTDRKSELRNKVYKLWKSNVQDNEIDLETIDNEALAEAAALQQIMQHNIAELKKFLVDRDSHGKKPELILSVPKHFTQKEGIKAGFTDAYTGGPPPREGFVEEFLQISHYPRDNQLVLEYLKKEGLVPEDSTTDDYEFLLKK
jgi:hypothetical protein